jgi:hypothetical protein
LGPGIKAAHDLKADCSHKGHGHPTHRHHTFLRWPSLWENARRTDGNTQT